MADAFDLVVIGSGPAGEKGAAQAAYYNKTVAVVEQAPPPGGIAVSSAGIPTKTLRETVLYVSGFRNREVYELGLTLDPEIALERPMTRKSEIVDLMTSVSSPSTRGRPSTGSSTPPSRCPRGARRTSMPPATG
jgi:pyruvate/2-oxoglutarate dehydrogenase complex dihydrolipoamide dehydrogenase (E3) component